MAAVAKHEIGAWSLIEALRPQIVDAIVPEAGGVYVMYNALSNQRLIPAYVGQSSNLRAALLQHLAEHEQDPCLRANARFFSYLEVAQRQARAGIEKYLFDLQVTVCNGVDPGGTPLPIPTIPPGWDTTSSLDSRIVRPKETHDASLVNDR